MNPLHNKGTKCDHCRNFRRASHPGWVFDRQLTDPALTHEQNALRMRLCLYNDYLHPTSHMLAKGSPCYNRILFEPTRKDFDFWQAIIGYDENDHDE